MAGKRRPKVKVFDVTVDHLVFRVDAFDWRSAQQAGQKRFRDQAGAVAPFVPKSAVSRVRS